MAAQPMDLAGLSSGAHPTTTFPNVHLVHGAEFGGRDKNPEPRGAHPTNAFPNAHLTHHEGEDPHAGLRISTGAMAWSPPEPSKHLPVTQLQDAVKEEDWARVYSEGKTKMQAQATWSAGPERTAMLQCLVSMHRATCVLEVGSFCGVAALAMAEALPKGGEVVALELEPYFVEFGQKYRSRSQAGSCIRTIVGPAMDSLRDLAAKSDAQPFDFVVIDGDKASMQGYFEFLLNTPGMLADRAVICLDMIPFKGQPPMRYIKFGQADRWAASSGEQEISALRAMVADAAEFISHEFGGLLVVQRRAQQA